MVVEWTRRGVVMAGVAVLAGCSTAGDEEVTQTRTATESETSTPTETVTATPKPTHPYHDSEVAVNIIESAPRDLDFREITIETLDYWVEHAPQYAGIKFDYRFDKNADVTIEYRKTGGRCGEYTADDDILGCAPILFPGDSGKDVDVWVVAGSRPKGRIVRTARHELGHVLGLTHYDEPAKIMSDDPADRIEYYDERIRFWDAFEAVESDLYEATTIYNRAMELWNRQQEDESEREFERARNQFSIMVTEMGELSEDVKMLINKTDDDLDGDKLEQLYSTSHNYLKFILGAIEYMQEAIDAYQEGSRRRHNRAIENANEAIEKAGEHRFVTVNEIGVALGLDDPIV